MFGKHLAQATGLLIGMYIASKFTSLSFEYTLGGIVALVSFLILNYAKKLYK